jgi:hypothetical protein
MLAADGRGRAFVAVPFDPDRVWRPKPQHHITGTVNGMRIRAVIETRGAQRGFTLGPAWLRDCHAVAIGDEVTVEIVPEGPQRDDLADDVAAALEANPDAGAFFDSLAQFYRKAYLRWIDATRRRPEQRAERITEMIGLLDSGIKQRPKP